jgi:two-component system response regulator DevR
LRVFIVEDSSMVRERLEEMLSSIEGLCSAGYATTADEAIRDILAAHPDVVVLDIRLAQGTGFDVLRALHERASDICVYMLSNFATPPYRRLAERLGAVEFFDKTNQIEAVREALAKRASRALN